MITGYYPSFLGGISQQDASVRGDNQVADSVNSWHHAALGTGKRPGAEFVSGLHESLTGMEAYHSILRDSQERYVVVVSSGNVRVFDHETGKEYVVVVDEAARAYLTTNSQPWSVFRMATTADTTVIVNVEKVAALGTTKATGFITGKANTFTELPKDEGNKVVPYGVIYEVKGAASNPYDTYWVRREGAGVWAEIPKPGVIVDFDKATLPHVLRRVPDPQSADGLFFTFGPMDYGKRLAGDEVNIPPPSFIGERIRDVFFHQGRLGFVTAESCCLSELGHPFNFWRSTTQNLLDTDVVDFSVETDGVAQLQFAIPYQSTIMLFGDRMAFQMTAEPYLTPKTPVVSPLVNYDTSRFVRPVLLGDSLYAVSDSGKHVSIREYFVDDISVIGDAADVTAHCPRLIPSRVRSIATAVSADMLLVAPENRPGSIFAYHVRWAGDEKNQSAWAEWRLSGVGEVVHMRFVDDWLYLLCRAERGGVEMLRINLSLLSEGELEVGEFGFLLDRSLKVLPVYTQFGNYTSINLPYALASLDDVVIAKTDEWDDPGSLVQMAGATLENGGTEIRFPGGDLALGRLIVGLAYTQYVELSRAYARSSNGLRLHVGRLQIRDLTVAYNSAAFFEVDVELLGRDVQPQTYMAGHSGLFTARTLDDELFTLGSPVFHSGERRFPVLSRAEACRIRLVNRLPYQCWFLSAQYRALYTSRSNP